MSLKLGGWKMNENGVEATLYINSVNPDNGEVLGSIEVAAGSQQFGEARFAGFRNHAPTTLNPSGTRGTGRPGHGGVGHIRRWP